MRLSSLGMATLCMGEVSRISSETRKLQNVLIARTWLLNRSVFQLPSLQGDDMISDVVIRDIGRSGNSLLAQESKEGPPRTQRYWLIALGVWWLASWCRRNSREPSRAVWA